MTRKRNNRNRNGRNTTAVNLRRGAPTQTKGGFSFSQRDVDDIQSLSDPFCPSARGSKLPDTDTSKSVAVTTIQRLSLASDANGKLMANIRPSLQDASRTATTITGEVGTTWAACSQVADYSALDAAFSEYRIVSWGVKIFSVLAPLEQSGYFKMITIPFTSSSTAAIDGINTGGSLFEEIRIFPTTDTTVQWISKPYGNEFKSYYGLTNSTDWDNLIIAAHAMPASKTCFIAEIYYNIECQVTIGSVTAALATPAADYKPHVSAAVGRVVRHMAGTKTGQEVQRNIGHWLKQGLMVAGQAAGRYALNAISTRYGVPPGATQLLIGN